MNKYQESLNELWKNCSNPIEMVSHKETLQHLVDGIVSDCFFRVRTMEPEELCKILKKELPFNTLLDVMFRLNTELAAAISVVKVGGLNE